MQDFNGYSKSANEKKEESMYDKVKGIAEKFDGKSKGDLLKAIYKEAEKGKRAGTLSNKDIENFASTLSPLLDANQKSVLNKLVEELKRI